MDSWMINLQRAYEAGYYKTEPAEEEQLALPWSGKTCRDCPFWLNNVCQVHARAQSGDAHTCWYFDEPNREIGRQAIDERMRQSRLRWWQWWADQAA